MTRATEAGDWQAALTGVAVADASRLSRLLGTGPDLLGLLQRLSTGDVKGLVAGTGAATVVTNNKGRIVQRLFVSHLGDTGVLLTGGPDGAEVVLEQLRRFTFTEDTGLTDISATTSMTILTGARSCEVLKALDLPSPLPLGAAPARLAGRDVHVLGTDGHSADGFALLSDIAEGETVSDGDGVRAALVEAAESLGGRAIGAEALEAARVLRGLAAHGHELTERYNPLEAGQRDAISFTKGCYIGQEVVARLENYDKVSRTLVGIEFPATDTPPPVDSALHAEGRQVGRVTSALRLPGTRRGVGIASIKHRDASPGETVATETGADALLVELPFAEARRDEP